jgi:hypothetical protein
MFQFSTQVASPDEKARGTANSVGITASSSRLVHGRIL